VAARATRKCPDSRPLSNLRPQAVGGSAGRVGEQLSRAGPSVKALLTGSAQSRKRLHKTSLSGSAGRKVAARATRKCPDSRALSNLSPQAVGGSAGRMGGQLSRAGPSVKALLTGRAQSRERLHRTSLSGSAGRKVAARATRKCPDSRPLSNLRPQAVGGSAGRVGEQLSRAGPSVKALLTGRAQSRERLHRTSLSGSAGRKVAGARNARDRQSSTGPKNRPTT
jgi:hypothetical protein